MSRPGIEDLLAAPVAEGPAEAVGRSRKGRPVEGFRFGEGPLRVSLLAGCHADEPVGPRLLRRLAGLLESAEDHHPALRRYEWWILPHLNPDGAARNRSWQRGPTDAYDLAEFLSGVVREPPRDDVEFGFPRGPEDDGARPENRAAFRWWRSAAGGFHVHASLHGTAVGLGPWFLVDEAWGGRTTTLQSRCRSRSWGLGYRLHDEDRGGEKGFRRISEGFSTRPDSEAMRRHFLDRGDPETAGRFRPSSMEIMRGLGKDTLTVVPEMPLFVAEGGPDPAAGPPEIPVPHGWKDRWRDLLREWARALRAGEVQPEEVRRRARQRGLRPMPVRHQMELQWELVQGAIAEVEGRRDRRAATEP